MENSFKDQRDKLFGREDSIVKLIDRANQSGLTIVSGRPHMGKTWTLIEVSRQLVNNNHMVGFHEAKGGEASHLLYAVQNLYVRWLSNSTLRQQALKVWQQHKSDLTVKVGQAVATLFSAVGQTASVAKGLDTLVEKTIGSLGKLQQDLQSPMNLAPLAYDEAFSLVRFVQKVSNCPVVLVLDAWEKSQSIHSEFRTLESIIKHESEWSQFHIILGIRNPELDPNLMDQKAFKLAQQLEVQNPSVELFELPPMSLSEPAELHRLCTHIRDEVPESRHISNQKLSNLIAGYPAVVNFWTNKSIKNQLKELQDFKKVADDAHHLRYPEITKILQDLSDKEKVFVGRLAFVPRLDDNSWQRLQPILTLGLERISIGRLKDLGILTNDSFPSLGHDTRHAATARAYLRESIHVYSEDCDKLVEEIASSIKNIDFDNLVFLEVLASCIIHIDSIKFSNQSLIFIKLAILFLGENHE